MNAMKRLFSDGDKKAAPPKPKDLLKAFDLADK
jgi:hypothetical protein